MLSDEHRELLLHLNLLLGMFLGMYLAIQGMREHDYQKMMFGLSMFVMGLIGVWLYVRYMYNKYSKQGENPCQ